nr:YbbR-like domain-containing protein [Lachnospiraceae bacterium]
MRKIMKYPALFVFSVALSIIIWLVVNNANDPVVSYRATNVPVRITHKEVLTANNMVYQVLDDTDVIDTVTIRAPRSIIDALDDENIIATADMNEMSDDGTIPIFLTTNKYASDLDSITGSISQVELLVENKKTKVVRLKCTTSGEVSEGYMVGDITPEQNQVRLSGGESAIDLVSYAAIDVNVTGFTADINTLADIKLCDEEGETVDST